jgi:hypothetical protein
MGVQDGQDVSAAITNPAFINKNIDDSTPSRLGLGSTASDQGPAITWAQQQFNSICSALGLSINQIYNYLFTWTNNYVGTSTDSVIARVQALVALFSGSTGHTHSGVDGQGPQIVASTLASVPYKGYGIQGTNYTSTATNSDVVTSLLTGRPVSTSPTVLGVVSTTPYNKTILRNSTTGDDFKDLAGNTVYGRLTFAASVWTHSYYSNIAGTETAYTFLATSPIEWFFQQIYNPMNGAPTYDPGFVVPSANATADIVTATTTVQGKTQLATATPTAIGATGNAGTANATVANADHTHAGVASIAVGTAVEGAMTFTGAGVTQSGNTFTFAGGGGGGGSLQWLEISNSPEAVYANGALVYAYANELEQVLNCAIKVPSGYVAGSPIKLLMPFYDPDSSGRILFQTIATLIRTGVDAITSTTNQRTSTNSSVTLGSGTVNIPQAILFDLSDSVGKVNSVAVSPGDILLIALTLNGSSTGASPANAMVYETEVTFS